LDVFTVKASAPTVTGACDPRVGGTTDEAYTASASYGAIDGDVLLGDSFPSEWCLLASVNCDDAEAGQLLYYEDDRYGFGLSLNEDSVTFDMRDQSYTQDVDYCNGNWNQFSVCYDGGQLILTTDCDAAVALALPTDPGFETIGGSLTIFNNGSGENEYTVSNM